MSAPPKPPPHRPIRAPKPGQTVVFKAIATYQAQNAGELSFEEDDILFVKSLTEVTPGMVRAICNDQEGLVRKEYIDESAESVQSPMHEAARRGNISFLQQCLKCDVSPNSLDKSGSTPLFWASHSGHSDILNILLAIPSICVTSQNKLGDTALHAASYKGHEECVQMLLKKGIDTKVRNSEGKTALEMATSPGVLAVFQRHSTCENKQSNELNNYGESDEETDL